MRRDAAIFIAAIIIAITFSLLRYVTRYLRYAMILLRHSYYTLLICHIINYLLLFIIDYERLRCYAIISLFSPLRH